MTAAKEQHHDTDPPEVMATRVVVGDGAVQTSGDDVDFPGREALRRLFGGPRSPLVSATLGRVKDAFRDGRNARER